MKSHDVAVRQLLDLSFIAHRNEPELISDSESAGLYSASPLLKSPIEMHLKSPAADVHARSA